MLGFAACSKVESVWTMDVDAHAVVGTRFENGTAVENCSINVNAEVTVACAMQVATLLTISSRSPTVPSLSDDQAVHYLAAGCDGGELPRYSCNKSIDRERSHQPSTEPVAHAAVSISRGPLGGRALLVSGQVDGQRVAATLQVGEEHDGEIRALVPVAMNCAMLPLLTEAGGGSPEDLPSMIGRLSYFTAIQTVPEARNAEVAAGDASAFPEHARRWHAAATALAQWTCVQ